MIDLESIDHIYLFPGSTDLRKGRHSLALLARRIYADDGSHEPFLFCNRKNELIKIYEKDSTGVWVYIRSLDETRFPWPNSIAEACEINKVQINWLLKGIEFKKLERGKKPFKKEIKNCIKSTKKLDLFGLFCYNFNMKKAVGINEVSKEELYNLYLKLLKKNERIEAKFLAMIFSIMQTAIANGLKAREYIEKLITEISKNPTEEELKKLLPWNIKF